MNFASTVLTSASLGAGVRCETGASSMKASPEATALGALGGSFANATAVSTSSTTTVSEIDLIIASPLVSRAAWLRRFTIPAGLFRLTMSRDYFRECTSDNCEIVTEESNGWVTTCRYCCDAQCLSTKTRTLTGPIHD